MCTTIGPIDSVTEGRSVFGKPDEGSLSTVLLLPSGRPIPMPLSASSMVSEDGGLSNEAAPPQTP